MIAGLEETDGEGTYGYNLTATKSGRITFGAEAGYESGDTYIKVDDVSVKQAAIDFDYDYLGRRITKTVGNTTTRYCYDGAQVIAEYENGTLVRKFIYGPGIDEPLMIINVDGANETKYYYHFDGLGSVVALSDTSGNIVERYEYDAFGEPNRVSDVNNPYMFTGRRYDPEVGLYYYRARYYAHDIGRFLQTDPIGYDDGLNMYTALGNNPLRWTDPSGLCKEGLLGKAWNWWEQRVQSSKALTAMGAFAIGGLEEVYNLGQALSHPVKSLGEMTVNTLERMYDFEVAAYNVLYDLGRSGGSSVWYKTWYDIGSNPGSLVSDVARTAAQSDLLSADPYTAGHAWGSLTVDLEAAAVAAKALSSAKNIRFYGRKGTRIFQISNSVTGKPYLRVDRGPVRNKGVRLHYHRGPNLKLHRPYEGGI
jgi:RHS repeat-associated protein